MSTQPAGATETAYAVEQKQHLVKTLGRFDMVFFTVAVIVGLDLIGQAASNGTEAITWAVVLTMLFLLPYGLVMAEVGSAFTAEGGPYEWVKLTMGRFMAGLNTIFYWVTNPLWIGGSLAFIATEAWSSGISHIGSGGFWDYAFKFLFIWVTISSAIISFRIGKWVPTLGAILKVALVCVFAVTVIIYGIKNGFQGLDTGGLLPDQRRSPGDRAADAVLLRRLRGPERRGRGDEGPPEGRPVVDPALRRARGVLLPRADRARPARAAGQARSPASAASSTRSRRATRSTAAPRRSSSA